MFDLDLIRNQDDEFNGRIITNGGKIYLIPDVEIVYYARETISTMMKMFYQYGLFKPLVNQKLGEPATLRQFVPPLFVIFTLSILLLPFLPGVFSVMWGTLLVFYIMMAVFVGSKIALKNNRVALAILVPTIFPMIHLSYGIGYLRGFVQLYFFNIKPGGANFSTSR